MNGDKTLASRLSIIKMTTEDKLTKRKEQDKVKLLKDIE